MTSEASPAPGARTAGVMGFPFHVVGDVVQALAYALVQRGNDQLTVTLRLQQWAAEGKEWDFWDQVAAPVVDQLGAELELPGYE